MKKVFKPMVIRVAIGCEERGTAACKYASKLLKTSCASYTQRASSACFVPVMQKMQINRDFPLSPKNPCIFGATFGIQKEPQAFVYQRLAAFFLRWEGDSNPRYGYPYVSLANWWFQPLTHPTKLTFFYYRTEKIYYF